MSVTVKRGAEFEYSLNSTCNFRNYLLYEREVTMSCWMKKVRIIILYINVIYNHHEEDNDITTDLYKYESSFRGSRI